MSFTASRNNLQSQGYRLAFGERFAAALRRRLYPNTTLTVQRFAALIRASERSVWSWLSGNGCRGEHLSGAIGIFGADFAEEVSGRREVQLDDETERHLVRIETELARIKAERRSGR